MFFCYDGKSVFYKRRRGENFPVLLLHGWGCTADTMHSLFLHFAALGNDVISLDFPGFGNSEPPREDFTVYDYAAMVRALLVYEGIERPLVVGHSFGCRVGIILAANDVVRGAAFIAAAGVKPRRGIKYCAKVWRYKILKVIKPTINGGSSDYRAASPTMRRVLVSVVNTNLEDLLLQIKCPTLIFCGKKDKETPPYMARKMHRKIKDSGLITLDGGHFLFLDCPREVFSALTSFAESLR